MQDYSGGNSLYIIEGKANDSVDIRATFYSETLEAGYGDEIVIGSCDFSKQKSDYLFDTEKYYKSNGIFLTVNQADNIDIVHSEKKTFKRIIGNYRERIISDFHIALGKDSGDLLSGMVFGEKRGMDQNVKTSVYRCGIGHILAVSGLHVSVFILILMTVLKCIGINKYISFVLMEALLIFITAMANYPISAIRAGIMMNFLYAAGLFRRQNDTFNSLAGAVLLICITEPYVIYDTGFILSVAGTFGIGVFAPYMTKNMPIETTPQKIICKIALMLCTMLCVFPLSLLAQIGLFKIVSESSVAAGVRRIEAVTGRGVLELMNSFKDTIIRSAKALKLANINELPEKCAAIAAESKEKDKKLESLTQQIANSRTAALFDNAKEVNGVKIVSARMDGSAPDALRKLGDSVKDKEEAIIALFAGTLGEKGTFYCVCTKEAVAKGANAGKIVREIAAPSRLHLLSNPYGLLYSVSAYKVT